VDSRFLSRPWVDGTERRGYAIAMSEMSVLARALIAVGLVLLVLGVVLLLAERTSLPLGRLPGDFSFGGNGWRVYFPLGTSIVLSILLTLLARLWFRR